MSTAAVSKTAKDALQAKWSAVSVGGYRVAPTDHDSYVQLIHIMAKHVGATKQQTPLVNAGYAMRVAVMLKNIQGFLDFHRCLSGSLLQQVQIVMLGAGMDVTGFWALSQLQENDHVHLVEVDALFVCQAKREALTALSWVTASQSQDDESNVWHGTSLVGRVPCPYSLVHADLRDIAKLQESLSFLPPDRPTLVCSELVLAYLGEQHCDKLMEWCSSRLCCHPMSCFLAFEPLGSQKRESVMSVLSGYQHEYLKQFTSKLNRGQADTTNKGSLFDTLGTDCASVVRRMYQAGWTNSTAQTCGEAAVEAVRFGADLTYREVFDEHAALTLHLQSYAMVVSFKSENESLLKRFMCAPDMNQRPVAYSLKEGSRIWLMDIERQDEIELRHQFSSAYERFFDVYPAIKKMVKTALRKDLALTVSDGHGQSKVHLHYRSIEGQFLVAVQYSPTTSTESLQRSFLGGIGWRKLSQKEQLARGFQTTSYEIHRLIVTPHSRRLGVARFLLNRAEEKIQSELSDDYQLIASTPSIQVEATAFYQRAGFVLSSETESGNLTLQTFTKIVPLHRGETG